VSLPEPFRWEGDHVVAELPGARALFATRRGGVSPAPYDSLNLGRLTEDDDANVDENRARLAAATGHGRERILYGRQVHGTTVRRATEPPSDSRPVAAEDGQATVLRGHPALVFTADCLPVVIAGRHAVAAVHAGWRGLAGGVIAEGVRAVRELGDDGPLHGLVGPGARGCCYETGEEVHAEFAGYDARVGERNLDLAVIAAAQLADAGAEVHDVGLCTICEPELFFSHRRDDGVTGRQAGLVWRT
jgi:purine-nucleoside/S-methyl-5'-thioadenosine phosphorylase / adenosine deaminase